MVHSDGHLTSVQIVYEDADLAVIAKSAGWVVNEASSVQGVTVQAWWRDYLAEQTPELMPQADWLPQVPTDFSDQYGTPQEIFAQRTGIVHRLDKDTSGVLVLAKHPGSLVNLLAQFRTRQVSKTYTALVHGKIELTSGTLDFPIARSKRNRQKMCVHPDGRSAVTQYQLTAEYQIPANLLSSSSEALCSLVRCWPQTGRMHQIRVHFAHINRPLVSDSLYLGRKRLKADTQWCPRHFLHASQIEFTHPRTQQRLQIEAPLPADLQAALNVLDKKSAT